MRGNRCSSISPPKDMPFLAGAFLRQIVVLQHLVGTKTLVARFQAVNHLVGIMASRCSLLSTAANDTEGKAKPVMPVMASAERPTVRLSKVRRDACCRSGWVVWLSPV